MFVVFIHRVKVSRALDINELTKYNLFLEAKPDCFSIGSVLDYAVSL